MWFQLFINFLTARKMNKAITAALLLCAALTIQARTVDDVVAEVIANDPALIQERARLQGLEDRIHQENTLKGPEVGMSYKWGMDGVGNKWDLEVAQEFEWPGLYRARSRQAAAQAGAFATLYRAKEVEQALLVRNAVYTLLSAKADVDLLAQWENNLAQLAQAYDRLLKRGETTLLEVGKINLEIFQARVKIAEAQARMSTAEADLKALNNGSMPANLPDVTARESIRPLKWYEDMLLENDPEIAAYSRLDNLARQEAKVTAAGAAPGFKLGYVYENEAGENFHGFSFVLNLPSWNNRAATRASKAAVVEAMYGKEMKVLERMAQVESRHAVATKALAIIEAAQDTFGSEYDYMTVLRKAFDGGKITLLEFIREQNDYLQAAMDYNALVLEYNLAAASLNRADFAAHD